MSTFTSRLLTLIALLCLAAVALALISQHVFGMRPCAWCVLQRLVYLAMAAFCLLALALGGHAPLRKVCTALVTLLGIGGMMAAWYQYSVAAHLFSCDLTFADRFITRTGLDAQVPWLFGIFASCMDARVRVLGLEYSLWSLGLFALLTVLGIVALARHR